MHEYENVGIANGATILSKRRKRDDVSKSVAIFTKEPGI